jgi:hypothetical protein
MLPRFVGQLVNQRDQVRKMLEQAGEEGVTTGDFLAAYLPRFSARIKELRDEGLSIETTRLKGSSSRYKLHPAHISLSGEGVEPVRTGSGILGGPETASRGSSRGAGIQHRPVRWESAAATSGKGADTLGGDGSPAVTALPTLFDMPRSGQPSHYESEAA